MGNLGIEKKRTLTGHKVEGIDSFLGIFVLDEPGQGNACHEYMVFGQVDGKTTEELCSIYFQNGPVKEFGVNGITQEVLIAVCIDRLRGFQAGEYACDANKEALIHLEMALKQLQKRTRDRINRGVEGTHKK